LRVEVQKFFISDSFSVFKNQFPWLLERFLEKERVVEENEYLLLLKKRKKTNSKPLRLKRKKMMTAAKLPEKSEKKFVLKKILL